MRRSAAVRCYWFTAAMTKELERAQRSIREGKGWRSIFPGVATLEIESEAGKDRLPVTVRLTRGEGPAVRRARPGEEALPYREVNPFDRWPFKPTEVAERAGLSTWKAWALIEHLRLKDDEKFFKKVSIGGGQVIERYSQAAIDQLRDSANEVDMDAVWKTYRTRHKIGRQTR
jgi:hypothetical protein